METKYVIVKTSFESKDEACSMLKSLLKKNLIASGQMKEQRSIYKWNGEICDEKEIELLCFTRGKLYNRVKEYISANHSYECPEILCLPITDASDSFGEWIDELTLSPKTGDGNHISGKGERFSNDDFLGLRWYSV